MLEQEQKELSSLKSLFILEAMAQQDSYVGINEICQETGYSQATVHRILNEMLCCGYAEKNERYKKYRIGPKAVALGGRFLHANSIVIAARPEMEQLGQATGETVHLLAMAGDEVIYLDIIHTAHTLGLMSFVGKKNPMYCTSGGKAILAFQPEEWLDGYLRRVPRKAYTSTTLVEESALKNALAEIRLKGYALDDQEHHHDVTCVGAPIFDSQNKGVAALSVAAPTYRFPLESAVALAPRVIAAANAISAKLGGSR